MVVSEKVLVLRDLAVDGSEEGDVFFGMFDFDPGLLEHGLVLGVLHFSQGQALLHVDIIFLTGFLDQLLADLVFVGVLEILQDRFLQNMFLFVGVEGFDVGVRNPQDVLVEALVVLGVEVEVLGHVQPALELGLVLEVEQQAQFPDPLLLLVGEHFHQELVLLGVEVDHLDVHPGVALVHVDGGLGVGRRHGLAFFE